MTAHEPNDPPRRPLPDELGFTARHTGRDAAVLLRVNAEHVDLARQAIAERMGVPVGAIVVDWKAVRAGVPGVVVKMTRAA